MPCSTTWIFPASGGWQGGTGCVHHLRHYDGTPGHAVAGFVGAIAGGIGGSVAGGMMGGIQGISAGAVMARTAVSAVFGGLAARATGGSFEDGALSAVMTHLFNDENLFNLFGKGNDPEMWRTAAGKMALSESDDIFDVYTHGNKDIVTNAAGFMNAKQLADLIRKSPSYNSKMAVRLWACNTGKGNNPIAKQLAVELNTIVIAPNQFVMYTMGDSSKPLTLASEHYEWDYFRGVSILGWIPNPVIYNAEGS